MCNTTQPLFLFTTLLSERPGCVTPSNIDNPGCVVLSNTNHKTLVAAIALIPC